MPHFSAYLGAIKQKFLFPFTEEMKFGWWVPYTVCKMGYLFGEYDYSVALYFLDIHSIKPGY